MGHQPNRDKTVEKINCHLPPRVRSTGDSKTRVKTAATTFPGKGYVGAPPSAETNRKGRLRRSRSRVGGERKNLNRRSNRAGENSANEAAESQRQSRRSVCYGRLSFPKTKAPKAKLVGNTETGRQNISLSHPLNNP
ncbi:hypothetical protein DY000_02040080 [Brassica cretica]|uniref:Uncharacterized protein n=1 Tax=Brassica cretica TaxID=69181 RepID=A0ABQ7BBF9_BRACR|nr:hypothetical protein DY000_02040080 [Brassica cretica]